MDENKECHRTWKRLISKKFVALFLGLIVPQFVVIILAFWVKKPEAWTFATTFSGLALGGITAYIMGDVIDKKLQKDKKE